MARGDNGIFVSGYAADRGVMLDIAESGNEGVRQQGCPNYEVVRLRGGPDHGGGQQLQGGSDHWVMREVAVEACYYPLQLSRPQQRKVEVAVMSRHRGGSDLLQIELSQQSCSSCSCFQPWLFGKLRLSDENEETGFFDSRARVECISRSQ
ncbi:hypothetical protein L3X38_026319 [Prunus dulcis]|uniref:Uncharacterized protein n=1 Tax=Prunus dulcis TaxID=3755 RepID=A0AAD4VM23_PRUDU|nr:hypothetical protein L3X38_026319 [Prunus dulcis]